MSPSRDSCLLKRRDRPDLDLTMASSASLFRSTRAPVHWRSQRVAFHTSHGKSIQLSEKNTVGSRASVGNYGIVRTSKPMSIGEMFNVTIMEKKDEIAAISLVNEKCNYVLKMLDVLVRRLTCQNSLSIMMWCVH